MAIRRHISFCLEKAMWVFSNNISRPRKPAPEFVCYPFEGEEPLLLFALVVALSKTAKLSGVVERAFSPSTGKAEASQGYIYLKKDKGGGGERERKRKLNKTVFQTR